MFETHLANLLVRASKQHGKGLPIAHKHTHTHTVESAMYNGLGAKILTLGYTKWINEDVNIYEKSLQNRF